MQIDRVRAANYAVLNEVNEKIAHFNRKIPVLFNDKAKEQEALRLQMQKTRRKASTNSGMFLGGTAAVTTGVVALSAPISLPILGISALAGGVLFGLGGKAISKRLMRNDNNRTFRNHVNASIALPFLEGMLEMVEDEMNANEKSMKNPCMKSAKNKIEHQIRYHERRIKA